MAHQQPSLEAKKAYFAHFKALPHSDDEDDDEECKREGRADDDELNPREQRMRHRHRRFFRKAAAPRNTTSPAEQGLEAHDDSGQGAGEVAVQATPEAVTRSALATPASKKPARATSKRSRNVVDDILESGGGGGDEDVEVIGETPIDASKRQRASATPVQPARRLPPKLTGSSSALRVGATVAAAAKKRKKDGEVVVRPEAEQIFHGLVFYYIPDNEIAPARRLRMQKAREYGAVRTSDAARATHVIVDRDIGYKDAEKAVATARGGVEGVVMVNEDYPIECVQFKALLDWKQKRYRLAGQPEDGGAAEGEEAGVGEDEGQAEETLRTNKEKLPLKEPQRNPRRWDYAPKSTPPHGGEESPEIDSQPIVLGVADVDREEPGGKAAQADSVPCGNTAPSDELTTVIGMMQEFKDLPLDNDEEEETASAAGHDSGSDDSDSDSQRRTTASTTLKKTGAAAPLEERFACARAGALDEHADNPNARTVSVLQSMLSYYERTSDQWRVLAYRRAIATLRRQPARVVSARAARRLPGVGARLAAKIAEIATTDRLQRLEHAQQDGGDEVLQLFLGVHGVGPALAATWAARGLRTLEDVRREVKLTPAQQMGIDRYEDLNTKIPRDEVEALARVVRDEAARVDSQVELTVGGSYRRGASSSSDVDFIVSKPGTVSPSELVPFLRDLVRRLHESQFLVATLAADGNIWQGCGVLPGGDGRWRRLDFLLVPAAQLGAALIYFTGDDVFNRSLRLLARKKGMKLNQRGLYRRVLQGGGEGEGDLVEGRQERRIFEVLGVQWREPTERWCR